MAFTAKLKNIPFQPPKQVLLQISLQPNAQTQNLLQDKKILGPGKKWNLYIKVCLSFHSESLNHPSSEFKLTYSNKLDLNLENSTPPKRDFLSLASLYKMTSY